MEDARYVDTGNVSNHSHKTTGFLNIEKLLSKLRVTSTQRKQRINCPMKQVAGFRNLYIDTIYIPLYHYIIYRRRPNKHKNSVTSFERKPKKKSIFWGFQTTVIPSTVPWFHPHQTVIPEIAEPQTLGKRSKPYQASTFSAPWGVLLEKTITWSQSKKKKDHYTP